MSAPLWTLAEAGAAMGAQAGSSGLGAGHEQAIGGISIDTRTLSPGDLFFAITGEARDGHEFVPAALRKGAAAAVVAEARAGALQGHGALIAVPDVLQGLRDLGVAARSRCTARIVAVTGSVGKTGTKDALRVVLSEQGPAHASAASYNNHWGVPLTLARLPREASFGVFEIGMNHAGEITPLVAMTRPHAAIITAIEPVHIENLGSIEAIADAKAEIFSGLVPGGTAIIPRDSPQFERLLGHARPDLKVLSFGETPGADIRLRRLSLLPEACEIEADIAGEIISYRLGSPGRHAAMNSLAVLGAVKAIGADVAKAAGAMIDVVPPSGRGQRLALAHRDGAITLLDESYNANPASMRAAFAVLARIPVGEGGRRVAILGDMLELGEHGPRLHAELAAAIEENGIDLVYAAGPLMRHLFDALPAARRGGWEPGVAQLTQAVLDEVRAGDAVTVKGSNGSRMSTLVAGLKTRYPPAGPDAA